jgi:hypothetical protein
VITAEKSAVTARERLDHRCLEISLSVKHEDAEIAVFITSDCDVTLGYINPKNDALNEAEING